MFSSNDTPAQDMKKAYDLGAYINLDDLTHVEFLEKVAGVPKTVCCRYNPGGVFELGNGIMDNPGDAKYGMSEDQMAEAYTRLMAAGAEEFGIHSFLASNTVTDDYYPKLAGILFELAVRLHKRTGAKNQVHQPFGRRRHCLPPRPAQQRHCRHRRGRAQEV